MIGSKECRYFESVQRTEKYELFSELSVFLWGSIFSVCNHLFKFNNKSTRTIIWRFCPKELCPWPIRTHTLINSFCRKKSYFLFYQAVFQCVDPLSINPTKWSNRPKQFVDRTPRKHRLPRKKSEWMVQCLNYLLPQVPVTASGF